MKLLHVCSEAYPLIKTGGLADVLGALPQAQNAQGDDARLLIPGYPEVWEKLPETQHIAYCDTFAGRVEVRYCTFKGVSVYVLTAPALYERGGNPYHDTGYCDYADNVLRFGLLGWVGAALACGLDTLWGSADVLHAHDWQAGLAPAYLKAWQRDDVKRVFTIHNIAYQGLFAAQHMPELWLPEAFYQVDGVEFYGQISFLKAGIYYADVVTTVSPTYADEITHEPAGNGFAGLLQQRQKAGRFYGVLNGVNYALWHPQTDKFITQSYAAATLAKKTRNKLALQQRLCIEEADKALLFTMVSRLVPQKGADLVVAAMAKLLHKNKHMQLAVLGAGERDIEAQLQGLRDRYPQQVGIYIGYDEVLSHQFFAAGDCLLVPSRFEPCGLTQLYGLAYANLPLVRRTGGLADTVIAPEKWSPKKGSKAHGASSMLQAVQNANGFQFENPTISALIKELHHVYQVWQKRRAWRTMQRNAMAANFGWEKAAQQYQEIYEAVSKA